MATNPARTFFLGLDNDGTNDAAAVAVLPAPLERTTSYGTGTERGPAAILAASSQVELFDEELGYEPSELGILTLPPLLATDVPLADYLAALEQVVSTQVEAGRFVLTLGGEHTLSLAGISAVRTCHGEIGTVQFDAHADLRQRYDGSRLNHACVMRRTAELGVPNLAVGIRSLSAPEAALIDSESRAVIWGRELDSLSRKRFGELLEQLPHKVYLTFDVDFFDPSLMPATGTPEPGGGSWYQALWMLKDLFAKKEVVAMDIVELSPIPGQPSSDFSAARLAYKCIGYFGASRHR